jgi:hypothetical protein
MDQVTQLSILKKFEVEQADIDRVRAVGPMLMLEIKEPVWKVRQDFSVFEWISAVCDLPVLARHAMRA